MSSQLEVIEVIILSAVSDVAFDNCHIVGNSALPVPICSIVYYTYDSYEQSLSNTPQQYRAIKLSGLQTNHNAGLLSAPFNLIVFGSFAANATGLSYRTKAYDWAGNIVGASFGPSAISLTNQTSSYVVPSLRTFGDRYVRWYQELDETVQLDALASRAPSLQWQV